MFAILQGVDYRLLFTILFTNELIMMVPINNNDPFWCEMTNILTTYTQG
jgi:hypothetical protein